MTTDPPSQDAPAITQLDVHFTASQAYPAFEALFLNAKRKISGGFRVFDLTTPLRSAMALKVGDTWLDLIVHTLNRGVPIHLVVTDFDPIIMTDDHRRSWSSAKQMAAANELSTGARLTFSIATHPARVGLIPRRVLRGKIGEELDKRDPDELTPGLDGLQPGDDLPLVPATHHQKLCVFDDDVLYIGGLDLNDRRYDTLDHDQMPEQTWQDIQAVVRGPVVAAAATHLEQFEAVTNGTADPAPQAPGFLRTLSCRRSQSMTHIAPKTLINEIETAHLVAVDNADGLIYLETQFFRSEPLADKLAEAAARNDTLSCMLVVPAAPEDVAFEANTAEDAQLGAQKQVDAMAILTDAFGDRLALASPAQPIVANRTPDAARLHGAPLVYVHSKLSLFGEERAILSSANLNGRSFRWDTEAGLYIDDPAMITPLWTRAFAHWFGDQAPDPFAAAPDVVARVNELLRKNVALPPDKRTHLLLPFDHSPQERLASGLPFVPDEMV